MDDRTWLFGATKHRYSSAVSALVVACSDSATALALSLANLKLRETLRTQAIRDELTGLYNRRYMEETLTRELARAVRTGSPLSLIMFDVDHFKTYNDTYGHAGGDALLRALGAAATASFRKSDVVCRYGGEEFVVVMPDAAIDGALARAEVLRLAVKQLAVHLHGKSLGAVTISSGVAAFPADAQDAHTLHAAADEALYSSKRNGRDRVTAATREARARAVSRHLPRSSAESARASHVRNFSSDHPRTMTSDEPSRRRPVSAGRTTCFGRPPPRSARRLPSSRCRTSWASPRQTLLSVADGGRLGQHRTGRPLIPNDGPPHGARFLRSTLLATCKSLPALHAKFPVLIEQQKLYQ